MNNVIAKGSIDVLNNSYSKGIMSTQLQIRDIFKVYKVDHSVNRDLGYHRIPKLVKYFDSIDSVTGIFLPAIVLSFRGNPTEFYNADTMEFNIPYDEKLIVIDGQHRIKGLEKFIDKSNTDDLKKEEILNSFLTVQIYFGLSIEDEKKMFTDINSNAKRVSRSLVTKFDTRDILNIFVRDLYYSCDALQTSGVEFSKSRIVRPGNKTFITSVRLKQFISYVLFGKKNPSQKNERQIKNQYDEIFSFFNKLFSILFNTLPSDLGDVQKYVLGHEPMQNAIALYLNESLILEDQDEISWLETWEDDVEQIGMINWSVKNRDWLPYMMTARKNTSYEYQAFIETTTLDLLEVIKRKLM